MDQCFSCISRYLRLNRAFTLEALKKACVEAFTGREGKAEVFELRDTADVKSWLLPYHEHFNNITGSHQYTFERKHVNGVPKAVMSIKMFAASSEERRVVVGCMLKVTACTCLLNWLAETPCKATDHVADGVFCY